MLGHLEYVQLKASVYLDDFYSFFVGFWPVVSQGQELSENFHLKLICNELQEAGEKLVARAEKKADIVINIPPSETKSTICSVMWPAWLLAKDPTLRIISGSYDRGLALDLAQKTRDVMVSDLYLELFPGTRLRRDTSAKSFYATTRGGSRRSIGSGSAVTGRHANVIIIDDPIDPKGIRSEAKLKSVNLWMEKVLPSRFIDKGSGLMLLVMQRIGEGDPTERMIKTRSKIAHICLPATDDYPIKPLAAKKFYKGGLMNPGRNSYEELKRMEETLGPVDYPAQYGQSPGSFEGIYFKKDYFTFLDKLPDQGLQNPVFWTVDTNLKGGDGSDPIGVLRWTLHDRKILLLGFWSRALSTPKLIQVLQEEFVKYGSRNSMMFIEPKASGPAVTEMLQAMGRINITEYKMPGNAGKLDRVLAVLPMVALHGCLVYDVEGFGKKFVEKCGQFPNVKNDEEIDCLTMAYDLAYGSSISNPRQWKIL